MIIKNLSITLTLCCSINSYAAPVIFTDSTAFSAAISTYTSTTLDFEGGTAGDPITNGSSLGGITFNYNDLAAVPVEMQIRNDFSAYSGANYLGTDDTDGEFQGGDAFSLSFNAVNAIGIFFLSGDALFDDDIALTINNASGITEALSSSVSEAPLSDGSFVYFLGLIDDSNTFTSVDVSTPGCGASPGCFLFNVDDITTAAASSSQVPTPPVLGLLLAGLIALLRKNKVLAR